MNTDWKKNVAIFLSSQMVSLFGSSLVQFVITWYITLKTQSGSMMTISILCGFVPQLLLSPIAGVWADRYNKKMLIILGDGLIALCTLTVAVMFFWGYDKFWLLFILLAVKSVGTAIQTPSINAVIPKLVPTEKLTMVNGLNSSIQSMIMVVTPLISASLYSQINISFIFLVDVLTAFIAIVIMLVLVKINFSPEKSVSKKVGYIDDMKSGFKYILENGYLKYLLIFVAIISFLAAPIAFLTPLQITRNYGENVWRLTANEVAFTIGMASGGFLISIWGGFKNRIHTIVISSVVMGIATFCLGVVNSFGIYLAFILLSGLGLPLFNTPSVVMVQKHVEEKYLGRVFSIVSMITSSAMPLGMLICGPLSDVVSIESMLIVTGILTILTGLTILSNKVLVAKGRA